VTASGHPHLIPVKGRADDEVFDVVGSIFSARNELEILTFIDRANV